jgi:hypothetical protein
MDMICTMTNPSVAHVHLLLPPEMRDQLRESAAGNFRSVSGEVRALLAEHLKAAEPARGSGLREGSE